MSNIIAPSSLTLESLEEKYKRNAVDPEAVNARKLSAIAEVGAVLVQTDGLNVITVRGSTPGFNDGDPCTHSQDVYLNYLSHHGDSCDDEKAESQYPYKPSETFKRARAVLNLMENELRGAFDTNWEITVTRGDNGTVTWTEDEYDCGY